MALDLGTMYAKVELDRRDYQQGMKEIPQQAETAFKQVASLAGKWLSAQILVGGLNDWQKEFSASLNKGVENALRIAVVGETARQTAEKIQAAEALKQAAMKKSIVCDGVQTCPVHHDAKAGGNQCAQYRNCRGKSQSAQAAEQRSRRTPARTNAVAKQRLGKLFLR